MKIEFKNYPIGFLTGLFEVSADTVRLYAKKGLLEAKTNETNRYRYFYREDVFSMDHIMRLKQSGFSLDEIQQIACSLSLEEIGEKFNGRISEIDEEIHRLMKMKENLRSNETVLKAILEKSGESWILEETVFLLMDIEGSIPGTIEYLKSLDGDLEPFLSFQAPLGEPMVSNEDFLDKGRRGRANVLLSCRDVNGLSQKESFPRDQIGVIGPCRFACSIGRAYTAKKYDFVANLEKYITKNHLKKKGEYFAQYIFSQTIYQEPVDYYRVLIPIE